MSLMNTVEYPVLHMLTLFAQITVIDQSSMVFLNQIASSGQSVDVNRY